MKKMIDRVTRDIDYLNKISNPIREILLRYKINDKAAMHESNFGEWEGDKELLREYSNIKVYSISNERLLVSRMFNRKRYIDLVESFKIRN